MNKDSDKKMNLLAGQRFKLWALLGVAALLAIVGYFIIGIHALGSATLRVQPTSGTLTPGGTVAVGIYADTGTSAASIVHVDMTFPTSQLSCQNSSISLGTTFPQNVRATCGAGALSIVSGISGTTGVSGNGLLIATVTFTVGTTPGSVPLTFTQSTSTITQPDGTNIAGTFINGNYSIPYPAPTVSGVSPASGGTAGGTPVTITGTNFRAGATVTFGGSAATGVSVVSGTSITATTPAHAAGAVSVVVSNSDGRTGTGSYTYVAPPPPSVSSVSPNHGPLAGGTTITVTGANFTATPSVTVGGAAATSVHLVSGTSLTAVTPARGTSGAVAVVVTNPGGQSSTLNNGYTYDALPCTGNPSVPSNLRITGPTLTSLTVSWNASNPAAGCTLGAYKLRRQEGSASWDISGTTYTDSGLASGITYHYTVEATDTSGHTSGQSSAASGTTNADHIVPTNPTNVIGTARDSAHVDLSWTGSTDSGGSGLAGYHIFRSGSAQALDSVGATTTSFTDSTVSADTDYGYTVQAYDGAGNVSAKVAAVPATIHTPRAIENQAPTVPQNLRTTIVTSSSAALAWDASTDSGGSGLAGYHLYRNGQLIASPSSPSYVDSHLSADTSYTYAVSAFDNAANASDMSRNLNVRTLASSGGSGSHVTVTPTGTGTTVGVGDDENLHVSDNVTFAPSEDGSQGPIQKVEYYLDGKLVATIYQVPFSYNVDTTKLLNGKHKLMTKTYYTSGNVVSSTNQLDVKNPLSGKLILLYAKAYAGIPLALIIVILLGVYLYLQRDAAMALIRKYYPGSGPKTPTGGNAAISKVATKPAVDKGKANPANSGTVVYPTKPAPEETDSDLGQQP